MQPGPFSITEMQAADLGEVAELECATIATWSEDQLTMGFSQPGAFHFVVREVLSNRLLAYLCGRLIAGEAEIYKLTVAPFYRRRGLANVLLRHGLDYLGRQGVTICFLEVRESNTGARRLYEKNGFTITGVRKNYYNGPVEDGLLLKKGL